MKVQNQIRELFDEFLKANSAYEQYWEHYSRKDEIRHPYDFITVAFSWFNSPEGHEYWYNLDAQWMALIKALDIRYINQERTSNDIPV